MAHHSARFYNPATGAFNRLDPFSGNIQDPQSLHKYLYVHGDPVLLGDPSGRFGSVIGMAMSVAIGGNMDSDYSRMNLDHYAQISDQLLQDDEMLQWYFYITNLMNIATIGVVIGSGGIRAGKKFYQRFWGKGANCNASIGNIKYWLSLELPGELVSTFRVEAVHNGRTYVTSVNHETGRIDEIYGPLVPEPNNVRNRTDQRMAGQSIGDGGHLIARQHGGPPGHENLVFMDPDFNRESITEAEGIIDQILMHPDTATAHARVRPVWANSQTTKATKVEYEIYVVKTDGTAATVSITVDEHGAHASPFP